MTDKAAKWIGVGLLAHAAVLAWWLCRPAGPAMTPSAWAQPLPAGGQGTYLVPAQLGREAFGWYILDVESGTVCVYRMTSDVSRVRLLAVRKFRQDSQLTDLNNDPPTPDEVRKLVEQQKTRQELDGKKPEKPPEPEK